MTAAYLNDGPRDGAGFMTQIEGEEVWVIQGHGAVRSIGLYLPRRDSLGELVPHDVTGTVEYEWMGWNNA